MQPGNPKRLNLDKTLATPAGMRLDARRWMPSSGGLPPSKPSVMVFKFAAPAILCGVLWTHVWIGSAYSILLAAAAYLILLRLSRAIPDFGRSDSFLKKAGYGERIWLNRLISPAPTEDSRKLLITYLAFLSGALTATIGGAVASPVLTATGLLVAYVALATCYQSLADLYDTLKSSAPLYRFWSSKPQNDN